MASPCRFWPRLLAGLLLVAVTPLAQASPSACEASGTPERRLVSESYRIASDTPGIELYVRNKRPAQAKGFPSERILLYVHGATYPSETAFDLQLSGFSWMDYIACRGFDVYLVDLRGYGQSTRPPEMERPAADHAPIVTTDVAVQDVGAAVDHILVRRKVKKINLLGWSWGTAIMGSYTAQNSGKVNRLMLYAPLWLRNTPALIGGDGPLGGQGTHTVIMERNRLQLFREVQLFLEE